MDIAQSRRRLSSTACPPPLGEAVRALREGREMSQVELAREVGLRRSSTISRLESGKVDSISLDLLGRLSEVLEDEGVLWAAAGALPQPAVQALAPMWRAARPDALRERTGPAVRRVHEGERAEALLNEVSVPLARRVDVDQLALALSPPRPVRRLVGARGAVSFSSGDIVVTLPTDLDAAGRAVPRAGDLERHRFLVAHAIAHIDLGDASCRWPEVVPSEVPAIDLACRLLAPQGLVAGAVKAAIADDAELGNPWLASSGRLAAEVARRLAVPAWVALRRLAEDGSYDTYAEDEA